MKLWCCNLFFFLLQVLNIRTSEYIKAAISSTFFSYSDIINGTIVLIGLCLGIFLNLAPTCHVIMFHIALFIIFFLFLFLHLHFIHFIWALFIHTLVQLSISVVCNI